MAHGLRLYKRIARLPSTVEALYSLRFYMHIASPSKTPPIRPESSYISIRILVDIVFVGGYGW